MEAALLLALLGYGAHQMIGHPEIVEEPQANVIYSAQTTEDISSFAKLNTRVKEMTQVDWSKTGNYKHGDSPETGVQWVFVTGKTQ